MGPAAQRFTAGGADLRQVKYPTNSDEAQIASDQLRLVTALEQPIRVWRCLKPIRWR